MNRVITKYASLEIKKAKLLLLVKDTIIYGVYELQLLHERLGHQIKFHVRKFLKQKDIDVRLDDKFSDT